MKNRRQVPGPGKAQPAPMHWDRTSRAASRVKRVAIAVGLVSALESEQASVAQTRPSVDARTWRPPVDAEASGMLEPATTAGPLRWNIGAWLAYAQDPVTTRAPTDQVTSRPLKHQIGTDITFGLVLAEPFPLVFEI